MRAARHRAVLVVLALLALLGWGAAPASAGGPTSVLLVNVADGRTASAHVSQGGYDRIWDVFGTGLGTPVTTGAPSAHGTEVRLTWLIHDVTPWRLDSVVRSGSDLWVLTQVDETGAGSLWDAPETWHRLTGASASAVDALLTDLGVTGPVGSGGGGAGSVAGTAPDTAPDARSATVPASEPADGVLAGWRLALVAAFAGVAVGLLAGRVGAARSRRDVDGRLDPLPQ